MKEKYQFKEKDIKYKQYSLEKDLMLHWFEQTTLYGQTRHRRTGYKNLVDTGTSQILEQSIISWDGSAIKTSNGVEKIDLERLPIDWFVT